MSSTSSISSALAQLLPSSAGRPPPKLAQHAQSLLAQSRLRAPHLKSEEEIARPYACAEIACQRLRTQLRLPANLKGRPPCKPAVYKKLLAFLEGVLVEEGKGKANGGNDVVTPTTTTTTTTKRSVNGSAKVSGAGATPSATPKKSNGFVGKLDSKKAGNMDGGEAPDWVMPLVRRLCKAFSTPELPPHVYTGVCVVLKLAQMWPRDTTDGGVAEDNQFRRSVSALIVALYLLVLTRMQQGNITTEAYTRRCAKAVEMVKLGSPVEGRGMVERWIKRLDREDYCSGQDWWGSVPEGVIETAGDIDVTGSVIDGGSEEDDDDDDELAVRKRRKRPRRRHSLGDNEDDPDGVLLPGLGTMMQDAVDWLSEKRRRDFLTWKEGILRRIKPVQKDKGKDIAVR